MDALGLGARICTDAVLIVDGANISAIPITSTNAGAMNQIISKLPQMMGMGQNTQSQGQQQSQQPGQQQNQ